MGGFVVGISTHVPRAAFLLQIGAVILGCASAEGGIRIIGAGPSRTGTGSLKEALGILGYNATNGGFFYHNKTVQKAWVRWLARNASFEPALRTLLDNGYNATLHEPMSSAYIQLLRRFPEAKVILTVRSNGEEWLQSVRRALVWSKNISQETAELTNLLYRPYDCEVWKYAWALAAIPEMLQWRCIWGYEKYVESVKRKVPRERLLVFSVKDGWGPLCKFLGVPVPQRAFPRHKAVPTRSPQQYMELLISIFMGSRRNSVINTLLCLSCSGVVWRLRRRRCAKWAAGFWVSHAAVFFVGLVNDVYNMLFIISRTWYDQRLHEVIRTSREAVFLWAKLNSSAPTKRIWQREGE